MTPRLCFVVCESLRLETTAALELERFADVDAQFHQVGCEHPDASWAPIADVVGASRHDYDKAVVLGGCCVESRGSPPAALARCTVHRADHCVRYLAGNALVDQWIASGQYIVTPGWLRDWPEQLQRWGLTRTLAREFFHESARAIVLADTGLDPRTQERLHAFSAEVELPCETVSVGLDYYRLYLSQIVMNWRAERQAGSASNQRLADCEMVFSLLGDLASVDSEPKAIERILDIFAMFCAPAHLAYQPLHDGVPGAVTCRPDSAATTARYASGPLTVDGDSAWTSSGRGFRLKIGDRADTFGILDVDEVAHPEYKADYVNLGVTIVGVCTLAIRNARAYGALQAALSNLQNAVAEVKTLRGIIPICANCKKIRNDRGSWSEVEEYVRQHSEALFSHGICPTCLVTLYPDYADDQQ